MPNLKEKKAQEIEFEEIKDVAGGDDVDIDLGDIAGDAPAPDEGAEPEAGGDIAPDAGAGLDFGDAGGAEEPAAGGGSNLEDKARDVKQQARTVEVMAKLLAMETEIGHLRAENSMVFEKMKNLEQLVNEFAQFRIPQYEEIELRRNEPEYIVPYISDALDKIMLKLFGEMPEYNVNKFDTLQKDNTGNIIDGVINVNISFNKDSRFKFLNFSLELFVIDGFLQIPKWFIWEKTLFTLTEEGIRKLDVLARKLDMSGEAYSPHEHGSEPDFGRKENWMTMNRGLVQTKIPHQVDLPQTAHNIKNVWHPNKGM